MNKVDRLILEMLYEGVKTTGYHSLGKCQRMRESMPLLALRSYSVLKGQKSRNREIIRLFCRRPDQVGST